MDTNLRFAETLAAEISPANWKASGMSNVKLRSFMPPGESLDLLARVDEKSAILSPFLWKRKEGKDATAVPGFISGVLFDFLASTHPCPATVPTSEKSPSPAWEW